MTATGNLLGTAISGLLASQRAMATTSHNVSNVNTPGYSRQRVEVSTRPALLSTAGFIGNGVNLDTVTRAYDQFITSQLRATTSSQSGLQAYHELARQVDNIVADPEAGLSPTLQGFFHALEDLANSPSSTAARQVVLSQAKVLENRFQYLSDRTDYLRGLVNSNITNGVARIDALGGSIAALNSQIYEHMARAAGQPPNDLLDQRDELIRQLSELVSVTVVAQDEAQVNVFIGNGQTLVLAGKSADVTATHNAYDPSKLDIKLAFDGGTPINVTQALSGGSIGGVLDFQRGMLDPTINALGRIAVGFSTAFNAQHRLGVDLNDGLGGDFFADLSQTESIASSYNDATTDYVFTSTVTDVGALKNSDYRIDYVGGTYTVRRLSDDTIVASSGVPTIDLTATEGFSISVAGATINDGDSFLLRPVGNGADAFRVLIDDTTFIAAAGPLRTRALAANSGSGKISAGEVGNVTNLPLGAPITLTYDPNALGAGVPGFTVAGGPGGTLAYDPATEFAGKEFTFAAYGGFTFTISGVPASGDQFVIQNNTGAAGDNRNALALAAFAHGNVLINGASGPTASVLGAYSQLVSDVGAKTHRAEVDNIAHQTLLAQAQEAWSNVSGVNLDEEAANLVRYQQAYQAAAQVVSAAQLMFDTLLGAVRR